MKIKVGMNLKWLGQDVMVTSMTHVNGSCTAIVDSTEVEAAMLSHCTIKVLNVEEFTEGDIIRTEYQSVEMEDKHGHIYYLYPYYNVKKEGEKNDTEGIARESEQASDSAA